VLYFGGRRDKTTILNSLGGDQLACDFMYLAGGAAHDNDFQAVVFIKVDVQARVHGDACFVLHVRENIAKMMGPLIVKAYDANDFLVRLADLLLNQVVPDEIANSLGATLIAQAIDTQIKSRKKILF
jgi:hypothetical protein